MHAAFHAVFVDCNNRLFFEHQAIGDFCTLHPNTGDAQIFDHRIMNHDATKIDWQAIFQTSDRDLKNADEILAFGDCARYMIEQPQMFELNPYSLFMHDAIGDVTVIRHDCLDSRIIE